MLADLRPALFLEALPPPIWIDISRRGRAGGRLDDGVAPFVLAGFGGCLVLAAGRLAGRDGEGDDVEELIPLV